MQLQNELAAQPRSSVKFETGAKEEIKPTVHVYAGDEDPLTLSVVLKEAMRIHELAMRYAKGDSEQVNDELAAGITLLRAGQEIEDGSAGEPTTQRQIDCLCVHAIKQTPGRPIVHDERCPLQICGQVCWSGGPACALAPGHPSEHREKQPR